MVEVFARGYTENQPDEFRFTIYDLNAKGTYLRISRNSVVSMAEVQVFGTNLGPTPLPMTNLALNGDASQISTQIGFEALYANDGDVTNDHMIHTNSGGLNWWMVDLKMTASIHNIRIFNRLDCCRDRLFPLTLEILDANQRTIHVERLKKKDIEADNPLITVSFLITPAVKGNFVRVSTATIIHIHEVEVYGEEVINDGLPNSEK